MAIAHMSRLNRPLLAVALFVSASLVRADALRLAAPADGTTLRGGSFAELRWSVGQLPPHTEEWEAFLSIDGGKYYAFRVTPHLDIKLRRFTFVVPNVETREARILIRTGDEVRETHFEARGTFSIVRDAEAELVIPRLLGYGRGEAAREGDPAVLAWAEGARNGSGITQHSSTTAPSRSIGRGAAIAAEAPEVVPPPDEPAATPSTVSTRLPARGNSHARKAEPLPLSSDLLLVCRRRNI
jgi:hypothetical protein